MLHQVGAGTLGPVFRAHDPAEGRLVAIKAFALDIPPERAAELASALDALGTRGLVHPSITAPIAAGVEGGIAWVAQAYVASESLDTALRQFGPPPAADALAIVTNLAGALDFAAAAGVLHGSLHPRDVLVAPGETCLIDLGVAAALERCGLRAPIRRPYSAPERVSGTPATRAADVFALAAIAYELLTGEPIAAAGDEALEMMPDIPGADLDALRETFSFGLAVAPDERFATALAFAAPLKKALGDALRRPAPPRRRTPRGAPGMSVAGVAAPPATSPSSAAPETVAREAGQQPEDHLEPSRPSEEEAPYSHAEDDVPAAPAYVSAVPEPIVVGADAAMTDAPPRDDFERSLDEFDQSPDDSDEPRYATWEEEPDSPLYAAELNASARDAEWERMPDVEPQPAREEVPRAVTRPTPSPPRAPRAARAEAPRPRASWTAAVVLLLAALVVGFAGGYFVAARQGSASSVAGSAVPTAGDAAGRAAGPEREFTEDAVPEVPAGTEVTPPEEPVPEPPAPEPAAPAASSAAPAESPSAQAPDGRLVIRSRPQGARVEVNGRSRGQTPLTLRGLEYGTHQLTVTRAGYAPEQRRVTLTARRPARTLDVALRRSAPPPPSPAERSGSAAFVGGLLVQSRPAGARVFVDGKPVGTTPLSVPSIAIGSHVVRLELDGYRRWTASVRVVAGERTRVAASLEEDSQ